MQTCGQAIDTHKSLLIAMLFAGLGGSLTHCLTMCSVFVVGQAPSVAAKGGLAKLLLPYHAGRITTYAVLGAVAAYGFHFVTGWTGFAVLRHLILGLVACTFLTVFGDRLLQRLGIRLPFRIALPGLAGCALRQMSQLSSATGLRRYALGLSLGLVPCPLVFAALMAVSVTARPLIAAVGMTAFGLGTMPSLLGLGFAGSNLLKTSPRLQDSLTLAALAINGVILLTMAVG